MESMLCAICGILHENTCDRNLCSSAHCGLSLAIPLCVTKRPFWNCFWRQFAPEERDPHFDSSRLIFGGVWTPCTYRVPTGRSCKPYVPRKQADLCRDMSPLPADARSSLIELHFKSKSIPFQQFSQPASSPRFQLFFDRSIRRAMSLFVPVPWQCLFPFYLQKGNLRVQAPLMLRAAHI